MDSEQVSDNERKNKGLRGGCLPWVLGFAAFFIVIVFVIPWEEDSPATSSPRSTSAARSAATSQPALDQMATAFDGNHSRAQIKARMDQAMTLYGLALTEDNYSRAGSTLVALRKNSGFSEMQILDYMIRSHVAGVSITFPEAAGLSAAFLQTGDR